MSAMRRFKKGVSRSEGLKKCLAPRVSARLLALSPSTYKMTNIHIYIISATAHTCTHPVRKYAITTNITCLTTTNLAATASKSQPQVPSSPAKKAKLHHLIIHCSPCTRNSQILLLQTTANHCHHHHCHVHNGRHNRRTCIILTPPNWPPSYSL
jgi:hypothetical protein